jgi:hypothetical protein
MAAAGCRGYSFTHRQRISFTPMNDLRKESPFAIEVDYWIIIENGIIDP